MGNAFPVRHSGALRTVCSPAITCVTRSAALPAARCTASRCAWSVPGQRPQHWRRCQRSSV